MHVDRLKSGRRVATAAVVAAVGLTQLVSCAEPAPRWGRLANCGFEGRRIKATLFFPGQARDGTNPYGCTPAPAENLSLYTVMPRDQAYLRWSEQRANQTFALDQMVEAGLNVISMSSWGEDYLPCGESWGPWAPMQTSTTSHAELFRVVTGKPLLVVPFIESRGNWNLYNEFPRWTDGRVAPGTVAQIINLVNRYLRNAAHPEWRERWARVYDRRGDPRYAVACIHAASNRLAAGDHAAFVQGFDLVAGEVFAATGIHVGFFIDALPPGTFAPGTFRPSPEETGPHLKKTDSILGIQCFIPEIWQMGSPTTADRIAWKRDFSRRWSETGIPFLMDVSPGYDAHLVFPGSAYYGFTTVWLDALEQMVRDFGGDGYVYNSWNGFTEGMAAMPLQRQYGGDRYYQWLKCLSLTPFKRADTNADGAVDIGDAICVLNYLFGTAGDTCKEKVPLCSSAADVNDDGAVDLSDGIYLLQNLFASGPVIPEPSARCGIDPTRDGLDCVRYEPCV